MMTEDNLQPISGSDLCLACGFCCQGIWFGHALIREEDVLPAQKIGLETAKDAKGWRFRLPCPQFQGDRCRIYLDWRPGVCGEYRCKLLTRYLNEEVSLKEAMKRVEQVKALYAGLLSGLPPGRSVYDLLVDLSGLWDGSGGHPTGAPAEVLIQVAALNALFRRHFDHHFKERQMDGSEEPG